MPFPFLPLIEDAGNRLLRLDPETLKRLGDLEGRVVCIEFRDLGRRLYLEPSEGGLRLRADSAVAPSVTLSGTLAGFARLGFDPERRGPAPGQLEIQGDVALGQRVQAIVRGLDVDWEEPLARLFGDAAGHALGRALRAAQAWHRRALATFAANAAEYLQEESRLAPRRAEVDAHLDAVDILRSDLDRLAARIERLATRLAG
jgi:ubiquinone biosynthesis protein UbiJ